MKIMMGLFLHRIYFEIRIDTISEQIEPEQPVEVIKNNHEKL